MRNSILRAALCGLLVITTSSTSAPKPLHHRCRGPLAEISINAPAGLLVNSSWVEERLSAMYPKPIWPPVEMPRLSSAKHGAVRLFAVNGSPPVGPGADFEYHKSLISSCKTFGELYEQAISFIKFHEGFAGGRAYYCAAGYKTIGYGHVVKPYEIFPEVISMQEADRLLRRDFDKAVAAARKYSPQLEGAQLLAAAHFCFAKGAGHYEGSTLRKVINSGGNPDDEFRKWCKYRNVSGVMVRSQYSLNIREWEIRMFHCCPEPETQETNCEIPAAGIDLAADDNISET